MDSDFETRLYLCHGGFDFISKVEISDLMNSYLIQFYLASQLYYSINLLKNGFCILFNYHGYYQKLRQDVSFFTSK
jgi:hypothetical protein